MSLLQPAEPFRAWEAVGATLVGGSLLAAAGRLPGWLRIAAATVTAVAMVALCLLAGGVPDEYLRPDHWGALIGRHRPGDRRAARDQRPLPGRGPVDGDRARQLAAPC